MHRRTESGWNIQSGSLIASHGVTYEAAGARKPRLLSEICASHLSTLHHRSNLPKQQCTYLIQPAGRCAEGLACQRPARLSDDQPLIVKPLLNHIAVKSLRDVALNFNDEVLAALVVASARPQSPKETASDRRRSSNFCDSHTTGVRYLSGS